MHVLYQYQYVYYTVYSLPSILQCAYQHSRADIYLSDMKSSVTWDMAHGRWWERLCEHTQLRSGAWAVRTWPRTSAADDPSVSKSVFTITEKAPSRAFPWLNAPKSIFTFKTLLRHYAKRVFTAHLVDVKLDTQHNYHKGLQLYDTPACLKTSLPFSPVT